MKKKLAALVIAMIMALSTFTVFAAEVGEVWDPFGPDWEPFDSIMLELNELFPPVNLGGITLRIHAPNPENIMDNDALREERMAFRDFTEQKYNITLEFDAIAGIEWGEVPTQIIASVAAGDPIVHLFRMTNADTWFPQLVAAGVLRPDDGWIEETLPGDDWWRFVAERDGVIWGHESEFPFAANHSLIYNREMVLRAGMEYTPSEMFMMGRWSYDEFYEYMAELRDLLPEGVYPVGVVSDWFFRGLVFANDGFIRCPDTLLPNFIEDEVLEAVRFMTRLVQSGIMAPPVLNPDTGVWAATAGVDGMFHQERSAMAIRQRWQFPETSQFFEFGVVGFPWGSNIEWPESDDFRDLAEQGYRTFMWTANLMTTIVGTPDIVTTDIAAGIVWSFNADNRAPGVINALRAAEAGVPHTVPAPNVAALFEDEDAELWNWLAHNASFETSRFLEPPAGFWGNIRTAIGTGNDVRPMFEALIGADITALLDRGWISEDDLPESFLLMAEEFAVERAAAAERAARAAAMNAITNTMNVVWAALEAAEALELEIDVCETCGVPLLEVEEE